MSVENSSTRVLQEMLERRADFHYGIPLKFRTGKLCEKQDNVSVHVYFKGKALYSTLAINENVALAWAEQFIHATALTLDRDLTPAEDRVEAAVKQHFRPMITSRGLDSRFQMEWLGGTPRQRVQWTDGKRQKLSPTAPVSEDDAARVAVEGAGALGPDQNRDQRRGPAVS